MQKIIGRNKISCRATYIQNIALSDLVIWVRVLGTQRPAEALRLVGLYKFLFFNLIHSLLFLLPPKHKIIQCYHSQKQSGDVAEKDVLQGWLAWETYSR